MSETSKVYFADFRCPSWRENLPQKLARLMMTAGFGDIDMEGKYVAIKMHFGEPGNLAYLRPNWAKVVADLVKSQGGWVKEFVAGTRPDKNNGNLKS